MYSGKIAVPPGGGGIGDIYNKQFFGNQIKFKFYNALPLHLKNMDFKPFKLHLKQLLTENAFYSLFLIDFLFKFYLYLFILLLLFFRYL
jgi:hypothetical protein